MLSDEWLSRYGLLENFNANVTRTRTGTGTGTWTTGVTAIALCTSCSRAKNLKKKNIFFRTRRPIVLVLGMKHKGMESYKIYFNHDPGMTLTYFTARST